MKKAAGWKQLPAGGYILEPGTSKEYQTGDWRSQRPIHDKEKCINCLQCWIYCPDSAIRVKDGKLDGIDYRYCKGCGICAHVCPPKASAIKMVGEREAQKAEMKKGT